MKFIGLLSEAWIPAFAQVDMKNAYLKIKDGGANSITVKVGEGTFSYTENRNMEYTLDRGVLDEVREGDQVPVDVSIDAVWEYITGGAASSGVPSIEDALKQQGAASGWTSTDADTCRPYAVDVVVEYTPQPSGCGDDETITISDFRYEQLAHDLRAGTISVTGKANVTQATTVRS